MNNKLIGSFLIVVGVLFFVARFKAEGFVGFSIVAAVLFVVFGIYCIFKK